MINKNALLISIVVVLILYILLQLAYKQQEINVFIINLDRSHMRKYNITAQLYLHGLEFNRFNAIDGRNYTFNEKEKTLFSGIINENKEIIANGKTITDEEIEQKRKNIMSCALSHILIWKQNIDNGPVLILEDDIIFTSYFKQKLINGFKLIEEYDPNWHILWISSGDPGNREIITTFGNHSIYRMNPPEYNGQGAMGYILSNKGLEYFTKKLEEKGCEHGIDIFLLKYLDIHHSYGIYKPLVSEGVFNSTI
jgi:GR25 family glycosyltransferase involved in LPS biosynthesis